jgi:Replication-relaxation
LDASSSKTRLPKTRRVPEAFSGRELTERSLKIIETIGRYRFLSSSKIIRLVGGNEDVTHRHLQQLFHRGLISRLKIPSAPANSEFVYFLENATRLKELAHDARINAEHLNFEEIRLNRAKYGGAGAANGRQRTGQMLFIEHELMISNFHAALESELSLSEGRVSLEVWQQGNKTWATVPATRDSGSLPHRPDAYFVLDFPNASDGQQRSHFFYEADRNTTSRTRFRLKLLAYVEFFLKGLYMDKYGARRVRAVLTETTDSARMELLKETAAELAEREPLAAPLFWFTTSGLIREKGIFSALWSCKTDQRQRSLLD